MQVTGPLLQSTPPFVATAKSKKNSGQERQNEQWYSTGKQAHSHAQRSGVDVFSI
jgi:hypothetical protein